MNIFKREFDFTVDEKDVIRVLKIIGHYRRSVFDSRVSIRPSVERLWILDGTCYYSEYNRICKCLKKKGIMTIVPYRIGLFGIGYEEL